MLTTLKVRVIPNAPRNQLTAIVNDEVRIKIHAPAHDGKANAEVVRFLAELIECQRSRITIKRGEKARNKIIEIIGLSPEEVRRKLEAARNKLRPN
jgi:uncharacterized protein